jgi:hypothetical protein
LKGVVRKNIPLPKPNQKESFAWREFLVGNTREEIPLYTKKGNYPVIQLNEA